MGNEKCAFFTSKYHKHTLWACQKVCKAFLFLLDNIFIRFGTKSHQTLLGMPMGKNCVPLLQICFCLVSKIPLCCPKQLHLNKANTSDTEAPFLDLNLSFYNNIISTRIYDKLDNLDSDKIINLTFLDGDVLQAISCGVYISSINTFC